jgi:hypothetical protein
MNLERSSDDFNRNGEVEPEAMKQRPFYEKQIVCNLFYRLGTCLMFAWLAIVTAAYAGAQSYQGSVAGTVFDPTGAVVPDAKVLLTDVDKGYKYNATTDHAGRYVIRALDPGNYTLRVLAKGFETYVVSAFPLAINQNLGVDTSMQVGPVTESVEVTESGQQLQTEDVTLGATFNQRDINDLPLVGRNIMALTFLAPGVTQAQGNSLSPTGSSGSSVNFVSNGQRNATAGVYVDGVVVTVGDPNPGIVRQLYTPSVDATQEYHVQQGIFRADTGFSGGTVINIITKSGSNKFHGTLYDFEQSSYLNANTFYNNLNNVTKPSTNTNIFGGVIGGPVRRDKTFFFLVFDGGRTRSSTSFSSGVPSIAERTGNFGDICTSGFSTSGACLNATQQLWDPYTNAYNSGLGLAVAKTFIPYNNLATYTSPGPPTGSGSAITLANAPGNLLDPTSVRMFQGFPLPNVSPGNPTYSPYDNFYTVGTGHNASQEIDGRIDNRFSQRDNLTAKFAYGWGHQETYQCFNNALDPCTYGPSKAHNYQATLIYTRTVNPNSLLSLSGGLIGNKGISLSNGGYYPNFDPINDLGLPSYIESQGPRSSPRISYSGYTNGYIGATTYQIYNIGFLGVQADAYVDLLRGAHEIKIGADYRLQRVNTYQPGVPTGTFSFTAQGTAQQNVSGGGGTGGNSLASFLIGSALNGSYTESTIINAQNPDYDFYVQDTWRILPRLTIDVGFRYEIQVPETESSNRISWFDPNAPSAITGYKGQIEFANSLGQGPRTPFNTSYTNFSPRVGVAYKVGSKMVIRAGYGLFYLPSIGAASGSTSGHSAPWNQTTTTTPFVIGGPNNGATPESRLNNPFPVGGVLSPIGNTPTPLAFIGVAASGALRTANATPYQQTWTFGVQGQLPFKALFNIYYLGSKGTHLYFSGAGALDTLPASVESLTPTQVAQLANSVTNPFYNAVTPPQGCGGYNLVCQSVLPAYRLMVPYPQFNGVSTVDVPFANSHYHSLQAQVVKPFSSGLQGQVSYTFSKSIDDSSITSGGAAYLSGGNFIVSDPNNLRSQRSLSGYDVPQNLVGSLIYELPYGHRRRFGSHSPTALNAIFGGWRATGYFAVQSGFPVGLIQSSGQPIYTYGALRPTLTGVLHKNPNFNGLNGYFSNPSVASVTPNFTIGNAPRFDGSARTSPLRTASLGVTKSFDIDKLRKGSRFELRIDSFNVFNHPQFGTPALDVASPSTFGKVTSQINPPRQVQVAGKLYF